MIVEGIEIPETITRGEYLRLVRSERFLLNTIAGLEEEIRLLEDEVRKTRAGNGMDEGTESP